MQHNPMPPGEHHDILIGVRIALARLEEQVRHVREQQEENRRISSERLDSIETQLRPVTESVTRWKGALTAIAIAAGAIGALVSTAIKRLVGLEQ